MIAVHALRYVLDTMTLRPDLLNLSSFVLECLAYARQREAVSCVSTTPLLLQDRNTISEYERNMYYCGITILDDHPPLLYRTGADKYPFNPPVGRFFTNRPTKTLRGVYGTPLNKVWRAVGPKISKLVKQAVGTRYSIDPARFIANAGGEDDEDTLSPVVVWIGVYPGSTSADTAYDVSKDILELLKQNGVENVEVEWHEAVVEKATGPALLPEGRDATTEVRRHLTTALGIPITMAEREEEDVQGTIGFVFHENRDMGGNPSTKVYAVTNHHVLCKRDEEKYEIRDSRTPHQYVQVSGLRRFQRGINEIKLNISQHALRASHYARDIIGYERGKKQGQNKKEVEKAVETAVERLRATRKNLDEQKRAMEQLEQFYDQLKTEWSDLGQRNIGHIHYSPCISVDVEGKRFTEDWGTIELLEEKFRDQFKGNVVDIGSEISSDILHEMLSQWRANNSDSKFPNLRQFRINSIITQKQLANSNFDNKDNSDYVVFKHGCTTDLTMGRYAGLESILCDEHGVESIELAIYNYSEESGPFSAKGDSGSLVFDYMGRMVGLLHSGRSSRGGLTSTHVTYATPAWWIIARIKEKYPYAEFYRTSW